MTAKLKPVSHSRRNSKNRDHADQYLADLTERLRKLRELLDDQEPVSTPAKLWSTRYDVIGAF